MGEIRLRENNKNTCAHGHMNLKIGPHFKQFPVVTRKGDGGGVLGRDSYLAQPGKGKSTVVFSISFGPKLIEVKTLISNSCAH